MKILEIVWVDAGGQNGWKDAEEVVKWMTVTENFIVHTIGYLFAEGDDAMTLVPSHSGDKVLDPIRIPKGMIISITEVEDGEKAESDEAD
jgi:hypothetical protein